MKKKTVMFCEKKSKMEKTNKAFEEPIEIT